jgi:hypothetical protein
LHRSPTTSRTSSWRCSTSGPHTARKRDGGLAENVRILRALLDLLESSCAPPGTSLGQALQAGYISVLEVVEATRAVPDPLAD